MLGCFICEAIILFVFIVSCLVMIKNNIEMEKENKKMIDAYSEWKYGIKRKANLKKNIP